MTKESIADTRAGLDHVRRRVNKLARHISAPPDLLPTYGTSQDFARPHIEFAGGTYSYVVVERGMEFERRSTLDLDQLLEWIFSSVTASMAASFAAGQPRFREVMFRHQLDLLGRISSKWRDRCAKEIDDILKRAPLVDGA